MNESDWILPPWQGTVNQDTETMQPNFDFEGAAEKADKNVKPQTEFCKKKVFTYDS